MTPKAYEQEPTRSSQRLPKHLVWHHLRTGGELCGRRFRGRRTGVTGASAFQLQRPTAFLEQCYRYPTQGVRSDSAWILDTAHSRHQLFNPLRIQWKVRKFIDPSQPHVRCARYVLWLPGSEKHADERTWIGGRFREQYYWDSFWIVEGLIESQLFDIVNATLQNFMDELQNFGFIPNGGRIYCM